jgi:uncharacterized protein YciI
MFWAGLNHVPEDENSQARADHIELVFANPKATRLLTAGRFLRADP